MTPIRPGSFEAKLLEHLRDPKATRDGREIAAILGCSNVTVSTMLQRLCARGLVRIIPGRYVRVYQKRQIRAFPVQPEQDGGS